MMALRHLLAPAVGSILALGAASAAAQPVSISGAAQGTAAYNMAAAIAKTLSEKAGMQARVQPFSGTSTAVPPVNSGEIDFTVANEIEVLEANTGAGAYAGRKQERLRMAAILFPFGSAIYVKKDSPMRNIADLKGKRLTYGYTAMVTLKPMINAMLANAGLAEKDIVPVLVPNVVRGADDFASGKADAFFFAVGAAKVTEIDAQVGGLRALQMSDAPQAVEATRRLLPQGYLIDVKPRPGLAGFPEPIRTLFYDYTFLAGAHVKDDTVYRVVKTMAENKATLVASNPMFNGFQAARMAKRIDVEFHPGAIRFYRESGQWPPKQ